LRQSISGVVRIFAIFLLPAAILGVPAAVINVVAPLHLFSQFWYHTQHINRMGFLEKIIVTPSHHRVHHAINPLYIDKNYGQIFIFWDKMFGTFQEERKDTPPVYGITRPVQTWNPIKINFLHVWLLIKDTIRTKEWKDKFRIWIMPTGWRPADMMAKYPVYKIENVYQFEKYNPKSSTAMNTWCWIQLTLMLLCISYLFGNIAAINNLDSSYIYIYSAFIFISIYAYTELMDRNSYAIVWEILRGVFGIAIIYRQGDWFGISAFAVWMNYVLVAYFIMSIIITALFSAQHRREERIKLITVNA
jgi:alkylglycerol monooxygenase